MVSVSVLYFSRGQRKCCWFHMEIFFLICKLFPFFDTLLQNNESLSLFQVNFPDSVNNDGNFLFFGHRLFYLRFHCQSQILSFHEYLGHCHRCWWEIIDAIQGFAVFHVGLLSLVRTHWKYHYHQPLAKFENLLAKLLNTIFLYNYINNIILNDISTIKFWFIRVFNIKINKIYH